MVRMYSWERVTGFQGSGNIVANTLIYRLVLGVAGILLSKNYHKIQYRSGADFPWKISNVVNVLDFALQVFLDLVPVCPEVGFDNIAIEKL